MGIIGRSKPELNPSLNLKLVFFIRAGKLKTIVVVFKTGTYLPGLGNRHFLKGKTCVNGEKEKQKYGREMLCLHQKKIDLLLNA